MGKGFQIVRRKKEAQQKERYQFRCLVLRLRYKTTLDTRNKVFPNSKRTCSNDDGKITISE
jgi:hypothetical protein